MIILHHFLKEVTCSHCNYALHIIYLCHMAWKLTSLLGIDIQSIMRVRLCFDLFCVCFCVIICFILKLICLTRWSSCGCHKGLEGGPSTAWFCGFEWVTYVIQISVLPSVKLLSRYLSPHRSLCESHSRWPACTEVTEVLFYPFHQRSAFLFLWEGD